MKINVSSRTMKILRENRHYKIWIRAVSILAVIVLLITTYSMVLPAVTLENNTYCGYKEHKHEDDCYVTQTSTKKVLDCTPDKDADFVIHTHDELCYDEEDNLNCNLTELKEHKHNDNCYSNNELTCQETEVKPHTHSKYCYDNKILTCGKPEIISHQHTDACFKEEAVSEKVLSCDIEEHTHEKQCFVQPESLTYTFSDDLVSGVITLPWSSKLPNDLQCVVKTVSENDEDYNELYDSTDNEYTTDSKELDALILYRMEWETDDESYTLPDSLVPSVELTYNSDADESSSQNEILAVSLTDEAQSVSNTENTGIKKLFAKKSVSTTASNYSVATTSLDDDDTATMELASNSVFGVLRGATITQDTDNWYVRVDSIEEIEDQIKLVCSQNHTHSQSCYQSDAQYLFMFANTSSLLWQSDATYWGQDDWYTAPVEMIQAKGYDNRKYFKFKYLYMMDTQLKNPFYNSKKKQTGYRYMSYYGKWESFGYQKSGADKGQTIYPTYNWNIHWQILPHNEDNSVWRLYENGDWDHEFYLRNGTGGKTTLIHNDKGNYWYFKEGDRYLGYSEDEQTPQNVIGTEFDVYMSQCAMLIFRYVGGSVDVLNDYEEQEDVEDQIQDPWTKKNYDPYVDVSDAKTNTVGSSKDNPLPDSEMTYSSDESTSNIESIFGGNDKDETGDALYNEQKENDGRVVTDKSVIYGDDDYDATSVSGYGSYDSDDFSVTLSALGQEWMVSDKVTTTAPIDVVYVLDVSGSMITSAYYDYSDPDHYGEIKYSGRFMDAMNAINDSMKQVLNQNSQNRVGLVAYSDISTQIMPIDRYTATDDNYLVYDWSTHLYNREAFTDKYGGYHVAESVQVGNLIKTADDLSYQGNSGGIREKGAVTQKAIDFDGSWDKTNTQQGIQEAYDMFTDIPKNTNPELDKTKYFNGKEYVSRKPVIILVTDGDPTLCTYNYMYPKEGPTYGQGGSHGVEGYYTVLSANYFKNLTSIYYDSKASFYTIGVGIDTDYQKAVLNPTKELVDATNGGDEGTAQQFYNLMEHSGGDQYWGYTYLRNIKPQDASDTIYYLDYYLDIGGVGVTNPVIRGMDNPYVTLDSNGKIIERNYSYCDGAWFDEYNEAGMQKVLNEILQKVQLINNYSFLLEDNTSLTMYDPIGDGMVVKGTPVLRIYGKNYAPNANLTTKGTDYVEYQWSGSVVRPESDSKEEEGYEVSLNGVKARITTTNGTQLVTFTVPDGALPSFYPDLYKTFYYEELPIRLIYRVGLSDDELNTLKNTKSEINKTYYTNKHNGADNEGLAYATFTPDSSNPYYNTAFTKSTKKNNNTTQTSNYALVEKSTASGNTFTVKQSLGNNGSLSFSRDEIEETEFVFPETGGKGTTLYSIFGVSLILCSVSVYIINKRRKEANSLDV